MKINLNSAVDAEFRINPTEWRNGVTDELSKVEKLIAVLEEAIESTEDIEFVASNHSEIKQATFRVNNISFGSISDRNTLRSAMVSRISEGLVEMQVKENIVKGFDIDIIILFAKTYDGEIVYEIEGSVISSKKITGGYDLQVEMSSIVKKINPANRKLLECVASSDYAEWNRWSFDLKEGVNLVNLDLTNKELKFFDFCQANLKGSDLKNSNLSYSNLSGANLEECNLENINFTGTEIFGATIPRKYMEVIVDSGIVEIESIKLVD